MPPKEYYSKGCTNTEFGIAHASTIMGKLQRFFHELFCPVVASRSGKNKSILCDLCASVVSQ